MDFGGWVFTFDPGEDLAEVSDFYATGLHAYRLYLPNRFHSWVVAVKAAREHRVMPVGEHAPLFSTFEVTLQPLHLQRAFETPPTGPYMESTTTMCHWCALGKAYPELLPVEHLNTVHSSFHAMTWVLEGHVSVGPPCNTDLTRRLQK